MDTQLAGNLRLLLHDLGIFTRVQTFIESRGVQVQAGRHLLEIILAECSLVLTRLVFKQVIVEFPKSILIGRTFAGLSRPLRFGAKKGQMLITQASFTFFYVRIFDLATRGSGETPTEGSLKIAEFDDGYRSVFTACKMAGLFSDYLQDFSGIRVCCWQGDRRRDGLRGPRKGIFGRLVGADATSGMTLPDIVRVARAYRIPTERISCHAELFQKVRKTLDLPGPILCEVLIAPDEVRAPCIATRQRPDGSMVSSPLEDLWPFLAREEFLSNMIIPPVEESL